VHISNINVPDRIVKLEDKIEQTKEEKIAAVKVRILNWLQISEIKKRIFFCFLKKKRKTGRKK
jgi:ATP-dependent Clp protease ATP-binding subunit ClpC